MKKNKESYKQVQDLIKKLNLDNDARFKDILDIDIYGEERNNEHEYWKNMLGRYLIKNEYDCIKLVFIKEVKCYPKCSFGGNWVDVVTDRTYFTSKNFDFSYYQEKDHRLSTTLINRYSKYTEITGAEYDDIINSLLLLSKEANTLKNKLNDTLHLCE